MDSRQVDFAPLLPSPQRKREDSPHPSANQPVVTPSPESTLLNAEQIKQLEADLWSSADTLRANSGLKSSEYATPILGLIFLKFADNKYRHLEPEILAEYTATRNSRIARPLHEIATEKCGFFLSEKARYDTLLNLPEGADIAKAIKEAMESIETYVPFLEGALPKDGYFEIGRNAGVLKRLLQNFSNIPSDAEGDLFGQIYEYFLGRFAKAEGAGGGEFFTPRSVVRLMVEIIEPHRGRVFDPACGSGGMFVQSARFIEERRKHGGDETVDDLFVCGQEKTMETVKLAKMNLVVNGLRGEIVSANTYKDDPHASFGNFDFVMANPPFNVDDVDLQLVLNDARFNAYGIPRNKTKPSARANPLTGKDRGNETVPNANYLWISLFATSLKPKGRAALVMANSASDAQHTEAEIRRRLIEANLIYGMVALPSNLFYTVTLPATLWFFERDKPNDTVLFLDARRVFTQIDRAHREFTEDQLQNLAMVSYLHRGENERFLERLEDLKEVGFRRTTEASAEMSLMYRTLEEAGITECDPTPKLPLTTPSLFGEETEKKAIPTSNPFFPKPIMVEGDLERTAHLFHLCNAMSSHVMRLARFKEGLETQEKVTKDYEKALNEAAQKNNKRNPQDKKLRDVKVALERFAESLKAAMEPFTHAAWLIERFPGGEYRDVVGLCKRATPAEIAEQDYSLNPGRYVGVVIEEDGKTAETFREDLLNLNTELETLNAEAAELASVIAHNVRQLVSA